ncbi:hypothetical protein [Streptomyces mexicanus]|jgi:hypothetical protein|uniref:DUF5709 domain-containing protein n=1 Tax=Streptomyces mexicanus TaxID=178566 RepID=A0A7X1LSV3_9ACTN|nr:hypothetical protein [Streptomyces mexicanus]MBC2868164.1 hypothetical protein [Streptomyces mexicanus]
MEFDPTDPETFEGEAPESGNAAEIAVEAPEGDAAEQHADIAPEHDDPLTDVDPARGNEADLVEQARVVSLDEDDYR